jgi:HEAT repeat protein
MSEEFFKLNPAGQVRFLKSEEFSALGRDQRVEFLKEIAASAAISSKCLASALKILRELRFRDRAFYKRFLDHPDSSVTMACKKALGDPMSDSGFIPMRELVKKQNNERRLETVREIVSEPGQSGEDMLLSFLAEDNLRVRELVVRELSQRPQLDEGKLFEQLAHAIWYTRAAIVEVLGNRRSPGLLARAGELAGDVNVEVRLKLLAALAKFDRDQVKATVMQLTQDPHQLVSREAKRLLAAI